jgi:hypothetical protein
MVAYRSFGKPSVFKQWLVVQASSAICEEKKGASCLEHIGEGKIYVRMFIPLVTLMRPTVKRKAVVASGLLYGSSQRGEDQRRWMER